MTNIGTGLTWHEVSSSHLEKIAYSPETATLYIVFKDFSTYSYKSVHKSLFEGLLDADSPGRYFNEHIRRLPTEKL